MPNKLDTALKATSSLFKLLNGMYIVRMAAQKSGQKHNPVTLSQAPSEGGCVDFFPAEKVLRNTLVNPGDCIVLRVKGEGATLVASEFHEGKPTTVKLQVERIDVANNAAASTAIDLVSAPAKAGADVKSINSGIKAPAAAVKQTVSTPVPSLPEGELSVSMVGHLQNRGDVVVKNDWLGKPGTNNRLEGFAIKVDGLPETVKLVYGCKFQSAAYKPQISRESKFVGTRKKAQAIQSVVFVLEGEDADQYEISGDLAFSDGIGCKIVANHELKCPKGDKHLVAINIKIKKLNPNDKFEEERYSSWTEDEIKGIFI